MQNDLFKSLENKGAQQNTENKNTFLIELIKPLILNNKGIILAIVLNIACFFTGLFYWLNKLYNLIGALNFVWAIACAIIGFIAFKTFKFSPVKNKDYKGSLYVEL